MSARGWLAWCLAAHLLAPAPARAQEPAPAAADAGAVLVWPLSVRGVRSEQTEAVLRETLGAGLARAQLPVVAAADAGPCEDAACRAAAGRERGAAYVAVPTVEVAARDYSFRIELIEVSTGRSQSVAETCSICGLEEACTILESLGPRLRLLWETWLGEDRARLLRDEQARRVREQEQSLAEQPRLRVTSDPPGSPVWIDGEEAGTTPLEAVVPAGDHVVEVRRGGFARERRTLALAKGTTSDLAFALRRLGKPPPTRRSQSMLVAGSVLSGMGLLGFGMMAIGLGRGATIERSGDARRDELIAEGATGLEITDGLATLRRSGQVANGIAAVGASVGVIFALTGVTLIGVSTTKHARRLALRPSGGRAWIGLTLAGRF